MNNIDTYTIPGNQAFLCLGKTSSSTEPQPKQEWEIQNKSLDPNSLITRVIVVKKSPEIEGFIKTFLNIEIYIKNEKTVPVSEHCQIQSCDPETASLTVSYAANYALSSIWSDEKLRYDSVMQNLVLAVSDPVKVEKARKIGSDAAKYVIDDRSDDNIGDFRIYHSEDFDDDAPFTESDRRFKPCGFIVGNNTMAFHNWKFASVYLLPDAVHYNSLISILPPASSSSQFTDSYLETYSVGNFTSATRTFDQTQSALFHHGSSEGGPGAYGNIVMKLIKQRNMSLFDGAAAFHMMALTEYELLKNNYINKALYDQGRAHQFMNPTIGGITSRPDLPTSTSWRPYLFFPCN